MNFKNETGYTKIKKPLIKIPPSITTDITDLVPAEGVEPDSQTDVNLSAPPTVDACHPYVLFPLNLQIGIWIISHSFVNE